MTITFEDIQRAAGAIAVKVPHTPFAGGGGLISGMAVAARRIRPDIQIIGVQPERNPSMHASLYNTGAESGGSTLDEGAGAAKGAVLKVTIETRGPNHAGEIIAFMREQPYIANISRLGVGD